jgi:hypothetical protein
MTSVQVLDTVDSSPNTSPQQTRSTRVYDACDRRRGRALSRLQAYRLIIGGQRVFVVVNTGLADAGHLMDMNTLSRPDRHCRTRNFPRVCKLYAWDGQQ